MTRAWLLALTLCACGQSAVGTDGGAPPGNHLFTDARLFPEGGAYDRVGHAFYVGSLEHGNITRVDARDHETIFYAGTGEAKRYTLGMQVDAARRLLWVCTTLNSLGRIWVFDLETGTKRADLDLTSAFATASCNDLVLEGNGGALVSDRENPIIYRVDPAAQSATIWVKHMLLESTFVHLNGIVFTPDHTAILTATYSPAVLVRINYTDPTDVRKVTLSGDAFSGGVNALDGADDLAFAGTELVVAFGTTLMRLTPSDASWAAAQVVSTPSSVAGVTALVTVPAAANDALYGINGQSVPFVIGSPDPVPFQIFRIP